MSDMRTVVEIQLDETSDVKASWIQIMTKGKYNHPDYGTINFTDDRLQRFADSVNQKVRGVEPDVDYDHKSRSDIAAGWIKKAEVRNDGLWAFVEWTSKAYQAIKDKEYKYFSPEFVDSWTHPKSGTKFQDVINGGALTNRPFLKDIAQLQLTESKDSLMDAAKVRKLAEELGLDPETATEAEVVEALVTEHDEAPVVEAVPVEESESEDNSEEEPVAALSEKVKAKLMSDPNTAKMLSIMESQQRQLEEQSKQFHEMHTESRVAKLSEVASSKSVLIPGKVKDSIKTVLSDLSDKDAEKVTRLFSDVISTGFVPVGEVGGDGGNANLINTDAVKRFNDKVSALMSEHKLSYADAAIKASMEDPDGFEAYRNNSYEV